ncbi:transcription antitermination factor NusB [Acetivibrio clariflavus]|uniref:Transcription antitermination protein NusB n=1 Tax=Acetivibrio clariflavus (strain DSM 19732 / NBRC 101661 / EBR45) TaxID=720554 RepID=G8LW57_ACECE|nr:transcription antitermination factor NusB [Acetivibrio clariflavus]AEV68661.1 transcription antitermination factor NusB [Acetivibrio clariflavus DSM 19732]
MGRRAAREIAMKLIYQLEIQKDSRDEQIRQTLEQVNLAENDENYIVDVVKGVYNNLEQIDKTIETYSKGWKLSRISKVDLSILRLGIYEMFFRDDIPFNVSINEAVELAKNYSGEDSGSFINGILGKVSQVKELPGKIEKTEST